MHRLSFLLCLLTLAACSVPSIVKPHRIEIQQGNYVSQEMIAQLKLGMSREQVRYVLGTPLVTDIFHADRWDYVYYREFAGKFEQRRVSVHFDKEGRLARVGGDVVSAGDGSRAPAAAQAGPAPAPSQAKPAPGPDDGSAQKPAAPAGEEKKERGFFGRILERIGL